MTDNEITKALRVCGSEETECWECPYSVGTSYCSTRLLNDTINLITKQREEIKTMSRAIKQQDEIIAKMQASQFEMANKEACQSEEIKRLESLCTGKEDQEEKIAVLNEDFARFLNTIAILKEELADARYLNTVAASDAIEEFAERVKMAFYHEFDELIPSVMADKIDGLVKEMTEVEQRCVTN